MRRLIAGMAVVACLVGCSKGAEVIALDSDGPFGGVYTLRQLNDAPLPLYFSPVWYPGRGSGPNVQSTTMLSGYLTVRTDGTYTWSTMLEEVAARPNSYMPEWYVSTVRREADGTWHYAPSTGAVKLEGVDQFGPYVLEGVATPTGVTLSSTFVSRVNSKFVLDR